MQDISFHSHQEDAMQRNRVSDSNVLMKGKKEGGREKVGSAAQGTLRVQLREKQPS